MAGNALGAGLPDPLLPDPSNPMAGNYTLADAADFWKQNAADTYAAIKNPQTWVDAAHAYAQGMLFGTTAPGEGNFLAYHGSPHSFDRFDLSKIGTGEGAQAYGHGLYFADAEDVARSYRDALAPLGTATARAGTGAQGMAARALQGAKSTDDALAALDYRVSVHKAANDGQVDPAFAATVDEARRLIQGGGRGSMYQVNIAASPEHMLDWDKRLSEQTPQVQDALGKMGVTLPDYAVRPVENGFVVDYPGVRGPQTSRVFANEADAQKALIATRQMQGHDPTGREIYHDVINQHGLIREGAAVNASQALRDAGIPGIRYLDASSRAGGEGTRNTVVFDDKLISILKKYGIAGLFMGGGAAGAASGGGQSTE